VALNVCMQCYTLPMIDLQRRFSCDMLENAGHGNDGAGHITFINEDIVRTKLTSNCKVTHTIRLVAFISFRHLVVRHCARSALRPFGIAPNDVRIRPVVRHFHRSAFRRSAFRHGAFEPPISLNHAWTSFYKRIASFLQHVRIIGIFGNLTRLGVNFRKFP